MARRLFHGLAQGVGLVLGVGLGLQKFFDGETELLGGVLSQTLPVRLGARLFDLDLVQHVPLGLVRRAALAHFLFEQGDPGRRDLGLFGQPPLALLGRRQQPLLLGKPGSRTDDLVLGGGELGHHPLRFAVQRPDPFFEHARFALESCGLGAGRLHALLRQPLLGAPAIETSRRASEASSRRWARRTAASSTACSRSWPLASNTPTSLTSRA